MTAQRLAPHLRVHPQFLKVEIALDLPPNRVIDLPTLAQVQHGGTFRIDHCAADAVMFQQLLIHRFRTGLPSAI
jgi:hypothetical protein